MVLEELVASGLELRAPPSMCRTMTNCRDVPLMPDDQMLKRQPLRLLLAARKRLHLSLSMWGLLIGGVGGMSIAWL